MSVRFRILQSRPWRRALILALVAMACGVLLGGLSAWFLGSVAVAGMTAAAATFNFHVPSAFVRLFAIGRTVSRYGERLFGHKAALSDQIDHRVALFASVAAAPQTRQLGWQLGDESRLANYLDDVEDVDYAGLRAELPQLTMLLGATGLLAATAVVLPLAVVPIMAAFLVVHGLGQRFAERATLSWARARSGRQASGALFGAVIAAVVPVKAERRWRESSAAVRHLMLAADAAVFQLRRGQARHDAVASLLGPLAGCAVLILAYFGGARGEGLLVPVFLAFAWLAFGDTLGGASRIIVARLRRDAASAALGMSKTGMTEEPAAMPVLRELRIDGLIRRSPAGRMISDRPLHLRLAVGRPLVLIGASGSGKTSLLKQIAGWIGDDILDGPDCRMEAETRRAVSTLVLHDAALLDDTVRANLFAPHCDDDVLWRALQAVEMHERIAQAGGLDAWIRQDQFSLGEAQRLNLARAWLSLKPLLVIDEPTEHIGSQQGRRILRRLAEHHRDRMLVLATHDRDVLPGAALLDLDNPA